MLRIDFTWRDHKCEGDATILSNAPECAAVCLCGTNLEEGFFFIPKMPVYESLDFTVALIPLDRAST